MAEKNLQTQLEKEMHDAMKRHDEVLLSTLRMLRSAISNRKIEKRSSFAKATEDASSIALATEDKVPMTVDLSDEEVLVVIRSEAKRRRDAVSEFTKAGRTDLAEKEEAELKILEKYLPAELSDAEIEKLVREAVSEAGLPSDSASVATSAKEAALAKEGTVSKEDFGRVMGLAMKKIAGRASGNRVQDMARKLFPLR